jgi:glycerol-3-phosphate O-acyltransferase/dihydroxyacetone phosphate acyltransferase
VPQRKKTTSIGKKLKDRRLRRPPSRRLVRHVLRVRAEAMRLLAAYLLSLDREGLKVPASLHMVKIFGGVSNRLPHPNPPSHLQKPVMIKSREGTKWSQSRAWRRRDWALAGRRRMARRAEVIKYLCSRDGNKVKELFMRYARGLGTARGSGADSEGEWAALSSEGEDDATSPRLEEEEMTWVPPTGRS